MTALRPDSSPLYDLANAPITRLRKVARWVDFQREDWWLPAGRPDPTIEQIIKVYELVVDVLGLDTIDDAVSLSLEEIVPITSYGALVCDSKGDQWVEDPKRKAAAIEVARQAQHELKCTLGLAIRGT